MSEFKFGDRVEWEHIGETCTGIFQRGRGDGFAWVVTPKGDNLVAIESLRPHTPPPPEGTVPVRIAVGVDRRGNADAIVIDPQIPQAKVDEIDARHGVRTTIINTYAYLPAAPAEVNATPEVSE